MPFLPPSEHRDEPRRLAAPHRPTLTWRTCAEELHIMVKRNVLLSRVSTGGVHDDQRLPLLTIMSGSGLAPVSMDGDPPGRAAPKSGT